MTITEIKYRCALVLEQFLNRLLKFNYFQLYVNSHYEIDKYVCLPFLKKSYFVYDGIRFYLTPMLRIIEDVVNEYQFDDIRNSDIVLDIGANIGIFSLFASRKAKQVFAVEPLYADELRDNIALNNISNISVLEIGLGSESEYIEFGDKKALINSISLSEILKTVGKCNFLKIDCEGCEWCISSSELEGFRLIEGEIHNFDKKKDFHKFEKMLRDAGFKYELSWMDNKRRCLIHANKI